MQIRKEQEEFKEYKEFRSFPPSLHLHQADEPCIPGPMRRPVLVLLELLLISACRLDRMGKR